MVQMIRVNIRPFIGVTLALAVVYAPVVAYVLWSHFLNYTGSDWILVLPVAASLIAGFLDHKLSAFRCAVTLACSAYAIAVADAVHEAILGRSPWYEVPMTAVFAAFWFSTAIFLATMVLVMAGRALWLLVRGE
jgi:hypothetical protein